VETGVEEPVGIIFLKKIIFDDTNMMAAQSKPTRLDAMNKLA
jgi:hypothetical protein